MKYRYLALVPMLALAMPALAVQNESDRGSHGDRSEARNETARDHPGQGIFRDPHIPWDRIKR